MNVVGLQRMSWLFVDFSILASESARFRYIMSSIGLLNHVLGWWFGQQHIIVLYVAELADGNGGNADNLVWSVLNAWLPFHSLEKVLSGKTKTSTGPVVRRE